jgi:Skp family chaperone for outer membrane proteins
MRTTINRTIRSLLVVIAMLAIPAVSMAGVSVSITIAPPPLPVYEQPVCPGDGYIWTPGYWAWDDDSGDYYWVPGTWVMAPEVGFFWTPAYWGWDGGSYVFYQGYWGPQIGFYGGINYGFGYFGTGYEGGRWDNGHFFYNQSVNNVNVTVVHNVYNTRVTETNTSHVSFNGGNGGINARPTAQEEAAAHAQHVGPVAAQVQHVQAARTNTQLRASANHGRPPVAATVKPGDFSGSGVVAAREGSYNPPARPENAPRFTAVHPNELPSAEKPAAPNTGDAKLDKKYQQQQDKLSTKQQQQMQALQKKQDQDHQKLVQQNANDAAKQQVEQKHQQQTQQLAQRHAQQQQNLQQRQTAPARQAQRPSQPQPQAQFQSQPRTQPEQRSPNEKP